MRTKKIQQKQHGLQEQKDLQNRVWQTKVLVKVTFLWARGTTDVGGIMIETTDYSKQTEMLGQGPKDQITLEIPMSVNILKMNKY